MASFLSASCSITRFKLVDTAPAELLATVPTRLKQFAFQNIDDIPELRAFGWVNFDDMLDADWRTSPPEKGEYFTFSMRVDTRRVPPAVIKKDVRVAIGKEMERIRELGQKFVSRERKKELKEQVILRLRSRFVPVPEEINVAWEVNEGTVWLASTQPKVIDMFTERFTQTFDLHLEQMTPYGLALSMLDEDGAAALDNLEPTNFAAERI